MKSSISTAMILLALVLGCSRSSETDAGRFEIYPIAVDPSRNKGDQLLPLDSVILADEPWITSEDILHYDWSTHEIELKPESHRLIALHLNSLIGPDRPFYVVANGERIYVCYSRWMASSYMFPGPYLLRKPDEPGTIVISPPTLSGYRDSRSDPRIRRCLSEAGVLVAGDGP